MPTKDRKKRLINIGLMVMVLVVLTSMVIYAFEDKTTEAENARTISIVQQYVRAIELVYLDNNIYPGSERFVCLGDYDDDRCWDLGGRGKLEDESLNTALLKHMPILSSGRIVTSSNSPVESYEGYIYRQFNNGKNFEIQYFLEGAERDCGMGEEVKRDEEEERFTLQRDITWCHITR